MNDDKREAIRLTLAHFEGKPVTQNALDEFTNKHGFEQIVMGDFTDYREQIAYDAMVSEIVPKIIAKLADIQFVPEFASKKERSAIEEKNGDVAVAIAEIFEEYDIKYQFINSLAGEIAHLVSAPIATCGTVLLNKTMEVMKHISREHFGSDITLKRAANYAVEVFEKAEKDNKAKAEAEKSGEAE